VGFEPTIPVFERAKTVRALDRAVGIRHADHVAPSSRKKLALTSLTSGGRSVGIIRLRTDVTQFFLSISGTDGNGSSIIPYIVLEPAVTIQVSYFDYFLNWR
jgi:hypothetical protein